MVLVRCQAAADEILVQAAMAIPSSIRIRSSSSSPSFTKTYHGCVVSVYVVYLLTPQKNGEQCEGYPLVIQYSY